MTKQIRNLIIGVAVIALAGASYYAINSSKTAQQQESAEAQNIYNSSKSKVVEVNIETPEERGTLVKQDVNWVIEGNEGIKLSQIDIDQAAAYLKSLAYTKKVGKTEDVNIADFGLDKGTVFTIKADDGQEFTVTVGSQVSGGEGYYALNGDTVYVISEEAGAAIKKSISDYRDKNPAFVDYSQLDYMEIYRRDKDEFKIVPNPDGEIETGMGEYILTEGFVCSMPVLTEPLAENIGGPVYEITAHKFIDNPESDSVYGLDNPYMVITLKDTIGYECIITIGDEADEESRYARFSGSDFVCTVKTEKTDKIYNADLFDIIAKYYINVPFTKIDFLEITGNGINDVFTVDSEASAVLLNQSETEAENFSSLYSAMASLTIDGKAEKETSGAEVLSLKLKYSDGTEEKIRFTEYDSNFYGVFINDELVTVSGKKMVDEFINTVKEYK